KLGQLRPDDTVRFTLHGGTKSSPPQLRRGGAQRRGGVGQTEFSVDQHHPSLGCASALPSLEASPYRARASRSAEEGSFSGILRRNQDTVYRASGDRYLLVEIGPNALDLGLRFRVHQLERLLRRQHLPGIIDITPGIRSLQVHYDAELLHREELVAYLELCERE